PQPPTLPDSGTIAYWNVGWRRCPDYTHDQGAPAFVDYLHLQMPYTTLNDRKCCNPVRGKFLRGNVERYAGNDCGAFGAVQLGGALPVGYGGTPDRPICCLLGATLYSWCPVMPDGTDVYPPSHGDYYSPAHYRLRMDIEWTTM